MIDYRVLLVDDQKEETGYLKSYLTRRGYLVFLAGTGEEGIDIVRQKKPQVILLDINLPGINGIDTLKAIRRFNRKVKVIMLSGYALDGSKESLFKELDVFQFIQKPATLHKLEEAIRETSGSSFDLNTTNQGETGGLLGIIA